MVKENSLLKTCIDILKTDDIKNEIKQIFSPVTDLIMFQIYPYIYFIIFLVLLIFVLILAILILLVLILRNNHLRYPECQ
jgi:ABC-type antimicrobial peptide transport system permease subunit